MTSKKIIGGQYVSPDGSPLPISKVVRAGGFVFVSGQVGWTSDGKIVGDTIADQARQALENTQALLSDAGCTFDDVVKATVWLVNVEDLSKFNRVYAEFVSDSPPARSAICSNLVIPGALVEIEVVAFSRNDDRVS